MKNLSRILISGVIISAFLMVSGCAVYPARYNEGNGPPQNAPAHGYRYKQQGHDLVYDSNLGVYVVVGLPDYYYFNNNYYRYNQNRWYYSKDLNRDWRDYKDSKLPPGLAKKYGYGRKGKDNRKHDRKDRDDRNDRNDRKGNYDR